MIHENFILGTAYYPEHWEEELWEDDFRRMKACGFNSVRMGESAWSIWEPEEGKYSFELFDKAIKIAASFDLKTILGTPTYAPPVWLTEKYPEVLAADERGMSYKHASRRHYSYSSSKYCELCGKIVEAMAAHYGGNDNIIGWQIDNEFNCHIDRSYSKEDLNAFRIFLRKKYKTIDALNKAWGTAFWSRKYDDFHQIDFPVNLSAPYDPSHLYDYFQFYSEIICIFSALQAKILRQYSKKQFITHNGLFSNYDPVGLTETMDFMGYDSYPGWTQPGADTESWHEKIAGVSMLNEKKQTLILEQQSGPGGGVEMLMPTPRPGQLRQWAWQSVANGAQGIIFFRWRTLHYGAEEFWHGILDHDNQRNRRMDEITGFCKELKEKQDLIFDSQIVYDTGIFRDYRNECVFKTDRFLSDGEADYAEIFKTCRKMHIDAVPIYRKTDFSKFKIIIFPHLFIPDDELLKKITDYVSDGGIAVFGARSGSKTVENHIVRAKLPGKLCELCGISVEEYTKISGKNKITSTLESCESSAEVFLFAESLKLKKGAEKLAEWNKSYLKGSVAAAAKKTGRGMTVYLGSFFTEENTELLFDILKAKKNIERSDKINENLLVKKLQKGKNLLTMIFNHRDEECRMYKSSSENNKILKPYEVFFFTEEI